MEKDSNEIKTEAKQMPDKISDESNTQNESKIDQTKTSQTQNTPIFDVQVNNKMTYKDVVDIDAIECEVNLKVTTLLSEIENEIISENTTGLYDNTRRKKGRHANSYYKTQEMKTNCALNAEEDLFEISGAKEQITKTISQYKNGDPVLITLRRKKIKVIFLEADEEGVAFQTLENKNIVYSYKQIYDDKMKFEKEI